MSRRRARPARELVVLLSHNGFDVDRKLAGASRASTSSSPGTRTTRCRDVVKVGKTLLVASGSHGKFVSRLDLDVRGGEVKDLSLQAHPDLFGRDRAGRRDGREDRRGPRAA